MGSSHSKAACGCRYLLKGRYGKEYSIPSCQSEVTIERTEREIRRIKARQLVAKRKGYLKARGLKRGISRCAPQRVFQEVRPMKSIKNFLEMDTVEAIFDRLLDNVLGEEKYHPLAEKRDFAAAKEKDIISLVANKIDPLSVSTNSAQESVVKDNRLHHKTLERSQAVVQNDGENQLDSEEEEDTSQKAPVAQHNLPLDIKVEGTMTDMPYEDQNQVPSEFKNEGLHSIIIDADAVKIYVKADIIASALDTIQMDRDEPFKAEQQPAEITALLRASCLPLDTEEEEAVEVSVEFPSKAKDLALDSEATNVPIALGIDSIKVYVEDIVQNDGHMSYEADHSLPLDIAEEFTTVEETPNDIANLPLDTEVEKEEMTAEILSEAKQQPLNKEAQNSLEEDVIKEYVNDMIAKIMNAVQKEAGEYFKAEQHLVLDDAIEEATSETSFEADCHPLNMEVEEEEAKRVAEQQLFLPCEGKETTSTLDKNAIKANVDDIIAVNIVQEDDQTPTEIEFYQMYTVDEEVTAPKGSDSQYLLSLDIKVEKEEDIVEKPSEGEELSLDSSGEERDSMVDMNDIKNCVDDIIASVVNIVQNDKQTPSETELYHMDTAEVQVTTIEASNGQCLFLLDTEVEKEEGIVAKPSESKVLSLDSSGEERDGMVDINDIKNCVDDIIASVVNIVQSDIPTSSETKVYHMDTAEVQVTTIEASNGQCLFLLDTEVEKEEGIVAKPSESKELSLDSNGEEKDGAVDMKGEKATSEKPFEAECDFLNMEVVNDAEELHLGISGEDTDSTVNMNGYVGNIIASAVNIVQYEHTPSETENYQTNTAEEEVMATEASNALLALPLDTKVEKEEAKVAEKASEELFLDAHDKDRNSTADMNAKGCLDGILEVVNDAEELHLDISGEETDSMVNMIGYVGSIIASVVNIVQYEHTPSETECYQMNTDEEEVMATEASDALRVLPLETEVEKEEDKVEKASEELFLDSNDKERNSTEDVDTKGCVDGTIASALIAVQAERAISNESLSHSLDSKVDIFVDNIIANAVKVVSDELAAVSKTKTDQTTYVNVEEVTDESISNCPFYGKDKQVTNEPAMNAAEIISNAGVSNTAGENEDFCTIVVRENKEDLTVVKIDHTKIIIADETVSNVMADILSLEETKEHSSLGYVPQNKNGSATGKEASNGANSFVANCEDLFVRLGRDDVKMPVDGVISNTTRQKEAPVLKPLRDDAAFGSANKQTTAQDSLVEKKKDAVVMEPPYAMAVLEKVVSMATALEMKQVTDYGDITNHQMLVKKAAVVYRDDTNMEDTASSFSPVLVSPQVVTNSLISARSLAERSNFTDFLPKGFGCDVLDNDVDGQIPIFSLDGNFNSFLPGKPWSRPLKDFECETIQWLIKETPDEQTPGKERACVEMEYDQSKAAMNSVLLQGIASWDKKSEHTWANDDDLPSIISNEGAKECLPVVNTGRVHSILLTDNYILSSFSTGIPSEKDCHSEAETNLSSLLFVQATSAPKLDIAVDNDGPCGPDDKPTAVRGNVKTDRTVAHTADEDSKKDIQPTADKETLHDEISYAYSNDILEHLLSDKGMAFTCYRKRDYPAPPANNHLTLSSLDFAQTSSQITLDTVVNDDGPCGPDVKTSVVKGIVEPDRTCALTDEDLNKDLEPTKETETSDVERSYADNNDKLQPLPLEKTTKTKLVTSVDDYGPCGPDGEPAAVKSNVKADITAAFTHDEDLNKDRETISQTETPNKQNEISYAHSSDNPEPLQLEKRTITKLDFLADGDGLSGPECTPPPSQKSSWIGALSSVIPFFGLNDQENSPEESPSVSTGNQAEELQLKPSESFATKVSRWFAGDDDDEKNHDQADPDGVNHDRDDDDDDGVEVEEKASSTECSKSLRPTELDETLYELEQAQEKRKEIKLQDEYDIQDVIIAMKEFSKLQTLESVRPGIVSMAFVGTFLKARDFMIDEAIKLYANYLVRRKAYSVARLTPFRNPLLAEMYSGRFTVLDARDQQGAAIAVFTANLQSLEVNYEIIMNSIYVQLDEVMKSPHIQEHGIVLLYDLSNTNYKTCDVQLCSKIIQLLKTAYPVKLRRTLLLSPPFCFEIRLFSAAVFRDPKVRENICSVTQANLTQYLPVTCIPKSLGGECDVDHLRLIEQCMLSNNTRVESMVDFQTGPMCHGAENDDCDDDAVAKDQRWFSLDEMPKSELDSNTTCHNNTVKGGSDMKTTMRASDEKKCIEDSSEKCKDIGPKDNSEKKNCDEVAFPRIKPSSSERKMNGYAWEQKLPVERIENISENLNVKQCSSQVNVKYSWRKYGRIEGRRNDVTAASKIKLCLSEIRMNGNSSEHPNVRANKCPSEKNIADARGKQEYLESRNKSNGRPTSNDDTIAVGPTSPSILGSKERDVHAGRFTCHYPSRVVPCLSRWEREIQLEEIARGINKYRGINHNRDNYIPEDDIDKVVPTGLEQDKVLKEVGGNYQSHGNVDSNINDAPSSSKRVKSERVNEREDNEDESFISKAIADPIAAVYNFFRF